MKPVRLRILLVGATGVVGRCVFRSLQTSHDVISASLDPVQGDHEVQLDLSDADALVKTLNNLGPLDAVISAAGRARFGALADARPASLAASVYGLGLQDKLMGQVNLAKVNPSLLLRYSEKPHLDPFSIGGRASMALLEELIDTAAIVGRHA